MNDLYSSFQGILLDIDDSIFKRMRINLCVYLFNHCRYASRIDVPVAIKCQSLRVAHPSKGYIAEAPVPLECLEVSMDSK